MNGREILLAYDIIRQLLLGLLHVKQERYNSRSLVSPLEAVQKTGLRMIRRLHPSLVQSTNICPAVARSDAIYSSRYP